MPRLSPFAKAHVWCWCFIAQAEARLRISGAVIRL
jgi:hypothetical protein